jgi:hypothetical protein
MSIEPETEPAETRPGPNVATLQCRIRYLVDSMQKASDLRVNPFALQLLAESLGDRDLLIGGGVMFNFPHDHKHRPVWIIVVGEAPFVSEVSEAPAPDSPSSESSGS